MLFIKETYEKISFYVSDICNFCSKIFKSVDLSLDLLSLLHFAVFIDLHAMVPLLLPSNPPPPPLLQMHIV